MINSNEILLKFSACSSALANADEKFGIKFAEFLQHNIKKGYLLLPNDL
jgi:hypothetical protein